MTNEKPVIRFHADKLSAENFTLEIPSSTGELAGAMGQAERKVPDSEQLEALDKVLTASLQEKLKREIPDYGSNPLLTEILSNLHVGMYNFGAEEWEPKPEVSPLEKIRQELTVELKRELDAMGLPSKGASVGEFLTSPSAYSCTKSKTCGAYCRGYYVYGTCRYWCC
jgi:hypothetical protein